MIRQILLGFRLGWMSQAV